MSFKMKLRQRAAIIGTLTFFCMFVLLMVHTELQIMNKLPENTDTASGNHPPVLQRRFLNREENSKVSGENLVNNHHNVIVSSDSFVRNSTSTTSSTMPPPTVTTRKPRDDFNDLFKYTIWSSNFRQYLSPPKYVYPPDNPTLQDMLKIEDRENFTNWERFHLQISRLELYPENSQAVEGLLHDMETQRIVAIEQLPGGTQFKLIITFENGGQALFKPMRFPRETETLPNHFYFTDYERHNSEIASYHLDRLLGFRRAPPVIGRAVNITSELYTLADDDLLKTFFVSPAGNICFHGQCTYYCDTAHAVCGNPDMLEGSFAAFLPPKSVLHRHPVRTPWKRSYNKRRKAAWETDEHYCDQIKQTPPYDTGRRLYDIVDMAAFDFLTGNMDRHHYEEVLLFGNDSSFIHWDHGRGFGKPRHDEFSILTPLLQCCVIRLSTFNRIYEFHNGVQKLSEIMRKLLSMDPLAPILTEPHLKALDRRVGLILKAIRNCLHQHPADEVFLDDLPQDIDNYG